MRNDCFRRLLLEEIPSQGYRDEYRRDYARVLHSAAFRRLEQKTQLFPGSESDFFRNRMTHSLEVASEGGSILMPEDYQLLYKEFTEDVDKKRLVCDFIAGMTDRYAIEFYGRLFSENPQSIFKPL